MLQTYTESATALSDIHTYAIVLILQSTFTTTYFSDIFILKGTFLDKLK